MTTGGHAPKQEASQAELATVWVVLEDALRLHADQVRGNHLPLVPPVQKNLTPYSLRKATTGSICAAR
jgi:hypothetical protein